MKYMYLKFAYFCLCGKIFRTLLMSIFLLKYLWRNNHICYESFLGSGKNLKLLLYFLSGTFSRLFLSLLKAQRSFSALQIESLLYWPIKDMEWRSWLTKIRDFSGKISLPTARKLTLRHGNLLTLLLLLKRRFYFD